MKDDDRLVWSSDGGRVSEEQPKRAAPRGDGRVRIRRETKGRRGKTVTVITGLDLSAGELADLAADLKKRCGVGGSAKGGMITIQGDKQDVVAAELTRRGYVLS